MSKLLFDAEGLRVLFWSPYEHMQEHNGKRFRVIQKLKEEDDAELALIGDLYEIQLEDGQIIKAWIEEIYKDSCYINGKLI